MGHEKTSVKGYATLFDGIGIRHSNSGLQITHMYINGFYMIVYDSTPDLAASEGHTLRPTNGDIRIDLKFAKALPETVTCLLYLEYDNCTHRTGLQRFERLLIIIIIIDTVQIPHALQDVNSFLGVYASDLLPRSIVQTGTLIVNTDPHTEPGIHWQTIHFQNPSQIRKRLLLRFLWPLSFRSLHPRLHTTPLYCLAIQQNATPRTYHYCLRRILLPLSSIHG
jgi:hypothetical protein